MIKKDQSLKQDGLRLLAFLFIVLGGIGTMIMTIIQFQENATVGSIMIIPTLGLVIIGIVLTYLIKNGFTSD
jgi:tryptophan-rich sensory protein|tara:strand:- start:4831 stop:5046 length:216 start_codon:yes stop_codon:yes gene_type:complete